MLGAIIGDIAGSRFEFHNHRSKKFELMNDQCFFTDDTVMSLALAKALLESKDDYSDLSTQATFWMRKIGQPYPYCGYGGRFLNWMYTDAPEPYHSFGNGAAMRVSACAYAAASLDEAKTLSHAVTAVTHNHPEGLKGAEATVVATYLALHGASKDDIRQRILSDYYTINFTIDDIRPTYAFNETCQNTVPQALQAFFESTDFEDAIRTAISVGGDSDTLAAITGAVAEAHYGIPTHLREQAKTYLDERLLALLDEFETRYPGKIEQR